MLKSSLYDYSDAYILVKGTVSIAAQAGGNPNNKDNEVVFKNCDSSTDCISERNNTNIFNIDGVMSIYNLIEYSDNYSKTSESLWQYYRDEPALTDAGTILSAGSSAWFKFKQKMTGNTAVGGTKNVEITVP